VVVTIFRGNRDEVLAIAREADGTDLVLQQGVHKHPWSPGKEIEEIRQGSPEIDRSPYSLEELRLIADRIGRPVRIRTHEGGESVYAGDRGRRLACQR
jgi:hypothetical protein